MSTATRLLGQLFRDPGENRGMLWMLIVNGLLAGHAVPARVRTVGYRLAGLRLHTTALLRPGTVVRDRALTIGAHSTINYGCVFDNRESVKIGDRVGVGIGVRFITSDHETADPRRRAGAARLEPIVVGDGVFIGSGATVLAGVTIGEGVVVAAGALVNSDCAPHGLYAGVPARRIRDLPLTAQPEPSTAARTIP